MSRAVLVATNCHPALPSMRTVSRRDMVWIALAWGAAFAALGACAWATWGL